jgi:hypothetical protein
MSFWGGYWVGVSQNIVAAALLAPFVVKWFKSEHAKLHEDIEKWRHHAGT